MPPEPLTREQKESLLNEIISLVKEIERLERDMFKYPQDREWFEQKIIFFKDLLKTKKEELLK